MQLLPSRPVQVCAASAVDYWRLGFGAEPVLPRSAAVTARRLLGESLVLATDEGAPAPQASYGLSFYRAVDTLPALFDKTRCAALVWSGGCHARRRAGSFVARLSLLRTWQPGRLAAYHAVAAPRGMTCAACCGDIACVAPVARTCADAAPRAYRDGAIAALSSGILLERPQELQQGLPLLGALRRLPLWTPDATDYVLNTTPAEHLPCDVRARLGVRPCKRDDFWGSAAGASVLGAAAAVATLATLCCCCRAATAWRRRRDAADARATLRPHAKKDSATSPTKGDSGGSSPLHAIKSAPDAGLRESTGSAGHSWALTADAPECATTQHSASRAPYEVAAPGSSSTLHAVACPAPRGGAWPEVLRPPFPPRGRDLRRMPPTDAAAPPPRARSASDASSDSRSASPTFLAHPALMPIACFTRSSDKSSTSSDSWAVPPHALPPGVRACAPRTLALAGAAARRSERPHAHDTQQTLAPAPLSAGALVVGAGQYADDGAALPAGGGGAASAATTPPISPAISNPVFNSPPEALSVELATAVVPLSSRTKAGISGGACPAVTPAPSPQKPAPSTSSADRAARRGAAAGAPALPTQPPMLPLVYAPGMMHPWGSPAALAAHPMYAAGAVPLRPVAALPVSARARTAMPKRDATYHRRGAQSGTRALPPRGPARAGGAAAPADAVVRVDKASRWQTRKGASTKRVHGSAVMERGDGMQ